jgi:hypothetical protein
MLVLITSHKNIKSNSTHCFPCLKKKHIYAHIQFFSFKNKSLSISFLILGVNIVKCQKFKKVVNYMDHNKDLANVENFNGEGFIMLKYKMQVMFQKKNLMDLVSGLEDNLTLTIGGDVVIVALKIATITDWEKAIIKPLVFFAI